MIQAAEIDLQAACPDGGSRCFSPGPAGCRPEVGGEFVSPGGVRNDGIFHEGQGFHTAIRFVHHRSLPVRKFLLTKHTTIVSEFLDKLDINVTLLNSRHFLSIVLS